MGKREFVYSGEAFENVSEQSNGGFLWHFQKAVLASLLKRGLLNRSQFDRCNEELEKQFTRERIRVKGS